MTKRKYICLALLMAVMLLVTGCDLVTVNRERDKAQVVIRIGDTAITKEQVYAVASTELAQSGMSMDLWDENLETYMREYLDEYLMEYVDGYAEYKVAVMLCDTLCPLTEEEIRQAEENTEGLLEYVRMMLGYDEENPEAYKGDIEADMDAYLKQTFGQTVAEYKASTLESNKYAHVYAKLTEGVAAQEGTAQAQYEKDLQAQKEAFAESADEYRSAITRNSMGDYILYKPAGYAVVKQILLGYEDEDGNAYDDLSLAKNEAEEELIEAEQKVKTTEVALETAEEELLDAQAALDALGKEADVNTVNAAQSTLNTAKANVASLKQELQEAQALHALTKKNAEEAIKAHTEGINSIIAKYQDKIDAIMNGYHNGVPFETLIDQYNEDPGLEGGSDFAVLGYTIIPGDQTYYPEFSEAALKLTKQGQISDPIVTESGVHILYAMYDIDEAADVPFAVAEPIVKAAADVAAQEEKFNSVIAEYMKEWNVKTWSKRMKFVK